MIKSTLQLDDLGVVPGFFSFSRHFKVRACGQENWSGRQPGNEANTWGVSIHWTGLLEWTTGLDYWTHPNCYKYLLSVEQKLNVLIQPVTLLMLVP